MSWAPFKEISDSKQLFKPGNALMFTSPPQIFPDIMDSQLLIFPILLKIFEQLLNRHRSIRVFIEEKLRVNLLFPRRDVVEEAGMMKNVKKQIPDGCRACE